MTDRLCPTCQIALEPLVDDLSVLICPRCHLKLFPEPRRPGHDPRRAHRERRERRPQ